MNLPKVLVVDDEKDICTLICEVAKKCGYESAFATTGEEFEKTYSPFKPDVIFMDLNIPNSDGIELLRILSKWQCKSAIVVMSGYGEKIRSSAMRLGEAYGLHMVKNMQKPFTNADLTDLLTQLRAMTAFEINPDNILHGIDKKQFLLYYQPKVDIKTNFLNSVEALLRWKLPDGRMIYPNNFISIAEGSDCIVPLTDWVIAESLKQSDQWKKDKIDIGMAINLSAKLLNNLQLPDRIEKMVKENNLKPSNITFEITETAIRGQAEAAMDILIRLRIRGFSLSIDDFGTGYSSLVELHRLPFNEIKIDKSFVALIFDDPEASVITNSIISLGHSLGLTVVAEGVETKKNCIRLHDQDCDVMQGFYLCEPLPAIEFQNWLSQVAKQDQAGNWVMSSSVGC